MKNFNFKPNYNIFLSTCIYFAFTEQEKNSKSLQKGIQLLNEKMDNKSQGTGQEYFS